MEIRISDGLVLSIGFQVKIIADLPKKWNILYDGKFQDGIMVGEGIYNAPRIQGLSPGFLFGLIKLFCRPNCNKSASRPYSASGMVRCTSSVYREWRKHLD